MKLSVFPFVLKMRHPWQVAHGRATLRRSLLVRLEDEAGNIGWGEAPEIGYLNLRVDAFATALDAAREVIESGWGDPESLYDAIVNSDSPLNAVPPALNAVDQAAHDLTARQAGQTVHTRWGLPWPAQPTPSNFSIGIDTIEVMCDKLRERPEFPVYKIKLGTGDLDHDLAIIRALREVTPARFRIDANAAWTAEQTLAAAPKLEALGVELIEQPMHADLDPQVAGLMKSLQGVSSLPVIADESCQHEADVQRCAEYGFSGVNVKVAKAGGLTPAKRMLENAGELGLQRMIGCMTETSVGISALAQLVPLVDFADLDGAELIANDPAAGVRFEAGIPVLSGERGTGVTVDMQAVGESKAS